MAFRLVMYKRKPSFLYNLYMSMAYILCMFVHLSNFDLIPFKTIAWLSRSTTPLKKLSANKVNNESVNLNILPASKVVSTLISSPC